MPLKPGVKGRESASAVAACACGRSSLDGGMRVGEIRPVFSAKIKQRGRGKFVSRFTRTGPSATVRRAACSPLLPDSRRG